MAIRLGKWPLTWENSVVSKNGPGRCANTVPRGLTATTYGVAMASPKTTPPRQVPAGVSA